MAKAKTIMLQGTSSHVGKSLLCTALCRILKQDGFKVAPFKAQNMALNSYITPSGEEIGYAQAAQAEAAGVLPEARMNPILLKPRGDMTSDVVVMGKTQQTMSAMDYRNKFLPQGVGLVEQCVNSLREDYDVVVIEGAGSPVEVNLKDRDIVNMKTAELADAPVLLVADIDRGGVFAAIIGTLDLLPPIERQRVKGLIINKFRGDIKLLYSGIDFLEDMTGLPVLGVIPYLPNHNIAQEDSLALTEKGQVQGINGQLDIAVIKLPRIANFTDFEVLKNYPGTMVRFVSPEESLGNPDAIILPSTKNVMDDLKLLWQEGTAWQIIEAHASGTEIIGIGGGFQMLGQELQSTDEGVEEQQGPLPGLGLLDIKTAVQSNEHVGQQWAKTVGTRGFWSQVKALDLTGYQVDCGCITYGPLVEPVIKTIEHVVGVAGTGTDVWGTTLHGLFNNYQFTQHWINYLRHKKGLAPLEAEQLQHLQKDPYDQVADHVRQHLDMTKTYQIIGVK